MNREELLTLKETKVVIFAPFLIYGSLRRRLSLLLLRPDAASAVKILSAVVPGFIFIFIVQFDI